MTATARIPRNLKKKLEASLQSLSPKDVGKLYAIYAHEADRKLGDDLISGNGVSDYPPIEELFAALDGKVKKSRGKPEEAEIVNQYNALVFVDTVFRVINFDTGIFMLMAFAFDAYKVMMKLLVLLSEDARTEMIRRIRAHFSETPSPVSIEDYDRLLAWAANDALRRLSDVTDSIYYAKHQAGEIVGYDEEGDIADEAAYDAIYDALVAKLEAGEIVGGEGFFDIEFESPILIEEGTIPAWAALRLVWGGYVTAQGWHIYDRVDYAEFSPDTVDRIGGHDGEPLDREALLKLAGDFYKDCRRRPWGKGLVANPDPDVLVNLLTQSSNPFLHLNPVDLGRVDWKLFVETEKGRQRAPRKGEPFETEPVATVGSLDALEEDVRKSETFNLVDYIRQRYYPVISTEFSRSDRALMFRMFDIFDRKTRQPFSFDRLEDGAMTMSEFMGVKFYTPLEQRVADLRDMNNKMASLQAALQTISDRYFGGISAMLKRSEKELAEAEDYLKSANDVLASWLEDIGKKPWNIDITALAVGEPEIDQDFADRLIDSIIGQARAISKIKEPEDVLFGKG